MVFRKILDALSIKAIRNRLDKRKLQEELDLHKLYLLTAYHEHTSSDTLGTLGDDEDAIAGRLDSEAQSLGTEGLRSAVSNLISSQLIDIVGKFHAALEAHNNAGAALDILEQLQLHSHDKVPQKPSNTIKGFGAQFQNNDHKTNVNPKIFNATYYNDDGTTRDKSLKRQLDTLSPSQVSNLFLKTHGFSLHVSPSTIPHLSAGKGLFLSGTAHVGQVIALYPGVAYPPLFHRDIPGYPLVARSNPYLLSRHDGIVLDAKPWMRLVESRQRDEVSNGGENWAETALEQLELRNPLALAHWANHPPPGSAPNVVIAAVDCWWDGDEERNDIPPGTDLGENKMKRKRLTPALRAYMPTVEYNNKRNGTSGGGAGDGALLSLDNSFLLPRLPPAPSVALVATRDVENEEIFLNYRLNPNAPSGLPDWYTPVDPEEDLRRWS